MSFPAPSFAHLRRLTDETGVFEHARGTAVRREHGYCLDDVARALVVVCRELPVSQAQDDLLVRYLSFTLAAQSPDGRFRNRRSADARWHGSPSVEDCWGRGLWGLGAVVASHAPTQQRAAALAAFTRGSRWRSPWSRAAAFAALGAAEVLRVVPDHVGARGLIGAAAGMIHAPTSDEDWPWPQPRLTYANAALPEVLIAAGVALEDPVLTTHGLRLLGWLVRTQTAVEGHLSVVPVGGRGPADSVPGFDQQPIEVAAIADACARAHTVTGEQRWLDGTAAAVEWFLGGNDGGTVMLDAASGGGCDGLQRAGRNENQGAESTLALICTLQHARSLATAGVR